ncbi:MAG: glycosyltransferase family 39 protein [Candidatus Ancaeobacter aquaticus]|nr:glycosyltransferase family 39 protein [Candidatus Ancaeobacter aquaticus]
MTFSTISDIIYKLRFLIVVVVLSSILLFFKIGDRHLWYKDEGRYAEIPREMVATGDYIAPHLNYVKYFEKPVLCYWMTALSYKAFGVNEFAARFPMALLGLITICAVYLFGKEFFGEREGFLSTLILLATIGFYLVNRYVVLDGPFTCFFTVSMCLIWAGYRKNRLSYCLLAYASMGCAVLTKGLIGVVLPVLIVGSYILVTRKWNVVKKLCIVRGVLVFCAVTVPWFYMVTRAHPEFFNFFFIQEHFLRYLTDAAGRQEPFYFFLIIGSIFFAPWTVFVPVAIKKLFQIKDENVKSTLIFLNIWWVAILVFFSLSQSKLPPYILPMVPALALVVGNIWGDFLWREKYVNGMKNAFIVAICALLGLIVYVLWEVFTSLKTDVDAPIILPYIVPGISLFMIIVAVLTGVVIVIKKQGVQTSLVTKKIAFCGILIPLLVSYIFIISAMEKLDTTQSSYVFVEEIAKRDPENRSRVVIIGRNEHFSDLGFYLKKRIVLVGDDWGELNFGKSYDTSEKYFLSIEDFLKSLDPNEKVYCVLKKSSYNDWVKDSLPDFHIIKDMRKRLLISNVKE